MPRQQVSERRLARLDAAATYAHVSVQTMRRRIAAGELTGYRFGPKLILVDLDELDAGLRRIPTGGAA